MDNKPFIMRPAEFSLSPFIHNQYITEQQVIDYCKEHENDPKLW